MRKLVLGAAAGLIILCGAANSQENFPARPITLVIPYPAGGGGDFLTRMLAEGLRKNLGQPVVVKNVTGAGGTIGSTEVARARPDGYTLLNNHIGMATAPSLYSDLQFDFVKSFEPIGLWADTPMALLASKAFAPGNMKELVEYVRKSRDKVTIASSGMGSVIHLCAMQFERLVGSWVQGSDLCQWMAVWKVRPQHRTADQFPRSRRHFGLPWEELSRSDAVGT